MYIYYKNTFIFFLFQELGFLHINNTNITPESLLTTLECLIENTISPFRKNAKNLEMVTSHIGDNGSQTWVTKIILKWPFFLSTEAEGYSSYNSQHEAALLLAHKLKVIHLYMYIIHFYLTLCLRFPLKLKKVARLIQGVVSSHCGDKRMAQRCTRRSLPNYFDMTSYHWNMRQNTVT